MKNKKKKKIVFRIINTGFIVLLTVSLIGVAYERYRENRNNKIYEDLSELITEEDNGGESCDTDYSAISYQNPDMVGWIKIEGTSIDYPVMQSETEDYYLNHNFYKEYSVYGVPYIPTTCDVSEKNRSDNVIIYGHHIRGGRMFSGLDGYKSESFYKSHKYINFDTLESEGTYEVIAAFKTTVYDDEGFKYYAFINAGSEAEFERYVSMSKSLSFYECSETAEYGNKLLTLSTCEYSNKNGRLVVVAKKI